MPGTCRFFRAERFLSAVAPTYHIQGDQRTGEKKHIVTHIRVAAVDGT
jgi:hypothetical protein